MSVPVGSSLQWAKGRTFATLRQLGALVPVSLLRQRHAFVEKRVSSIILADGAERQRLKERVCA